MASKVDFPMPDPENRPSRCPCRTVAKQLSAPTPRSSRSPSCARSVASGGGARTRRGCPTGKAPRPSNGRPNGSTTRPSQSSPTGNVPPRWRVTVAGAPGPIPSSGANGIAWTRPPRIPTTSAWTWSPPRISSTSRSPSDKWPISPSTSTTRPDTPATRPSSRSSGRRARSARQAATRSAKLANLIGRHLVPIIYLCRNTIALPQLFWALSHGDTRKW